MTLSIPSISPSSWTVNTTVALLRPVRIVALGWIPIDDGESDERSTSRSASTTALTVTSPVIVPDPSMTDAGKAKVRVADSSSWMRTASLPSAQPGAEAVIVACWVPSRASSFWTTTVKGAEACPIASVMKLVARVTSLVSVDVSCTTRPDAGGGFAETTPMNVPEPSSAPAGRSIVNGKRTSNGLLSPGWPSASARRNRLDARS